GDDRLALLSHLHDPSPLRRDRLLVATAHDHLAPWELHLEPLAKHGDDLVGVRALRALDGLRDDVCAGVSPGRAQFGLRVFHAWGWRPFRVLLVPLAELGMPRQHPLIVPGEGRGDGADGRFLAEGVQLVGGADGGRDVTDLFYQPEGPSLLDESDL